MKTLKIAVVDNPTVVLRPSPGNPREYPHKPYMLYRQKLESLPTLLLLIVWAYLHSNFYGGLRNTHLFCNRVHIGRSTSSKVVEFFLPHSHLTPSLGVNPFEFLDQLFVADCGYM